MGFIHVGHENSFVYDIADLYKAEITIPIAFEVASAEPEDLPGVVRRRVRDEIASSHILERMVKDIRLLFSGDEEKVDPIPEVDVTYLWDTRKGIVANGISYTEKEV